MLFFRILFLLMCLFSLVNCSQRKKQELTNSNEFDIRDSVVFDVGFKSRSNYEGLTCDKSTGKQLVYFGDPVTEKKIKLFNLNGELEATIPLVEVEKELGTEIQMLMISPDTIILHEVHSSRFLCINRKGEIWHTTNLKEIKDSKNRIYTTGFFATSSSMNELFVNCALATDGFPDKPDSIISHFDAYKYYYNQSFFAPMMYKIDGFFGPQPRIHFCMADYASKASDKVYAGINFVRKARIMNNRIIANCFYDDKLIFGNTKTFLTDTFITLTSKYSAVSKLTRSINSFNTENDLINFLSKQQERILKTGGIVDFLFDKSKNKYYVFILHRNENSPDYFVREVNFSVVSYDKKIKSIK